MLECGLDAKAYVNEGRKSVKHKGEEDENNSRPEKNSTKKADDKKKEEAASRPEPQVKKVETVKVSASKDAVRAPTFIVVPEPKPAVASSPRKPSAEKRSVGRPSADKARKAASPSSKKPLQVEPIAAVPTTNVTAPVQAGTSQPKTFI